jgi:hypothetical protein
VVRMDLPGVWRVATRVFPLLRRRIVVDRRSRETLKAMVAGAAHNVLHVATEADSVYAFDAQSGATLWQVSLLGPGESTSGAVDGRGQVVPEIGVTSTPVIDPSAGPHGVLYVVAMPRTIR